MKKVVSLLAVAGLVAASSAAFGATIVSSKHNLSASGVGAAYTVGSSTQICVYCHAPHGANLSLPLWNRTNPTASAFTLYSGVNMANVSFKTGFTADSTSLFCMSCHDGITNLNAVHNTGNIIRTTGETLTAGQVSGNANLTRDLSKTHPVNFPVTLNGQSDLNLTGSVMGPGVAIAGMTKTFPLFKTSVAGNSARTTANASLECGSCHSVHDNTNQPFLRDTMDQSKLCLGCHNK